MSGAKIAYSSNIPLFIVVIIVGLIFSNHLGFKDNNIATIYAQSSLSPSFTDQEARDYLMDLMELQNQTSTNESSLVDENIGDANTSETGLATQQFATDVSGHYSNPNYGILDFVLPSGWYGSEGQPSGDKSISLNMHEGTEAEYEDRPSSLPSGEGAVEIEPTMTLESNDKKQMQSAQLGLGEEPSVAEKAAASQCKSLDGSIRFLEPNSTATIDGKAFNVFTMECNWKTNSGSSTEVSKTYRYDSPERIYSLQLKVSKDSIGQNISQTSIDMKKYTPIIDKAVQTIKIK